MPVPEGVITSTETWKLVPEEPAPAPAKPAKAKKVVAEPVEEELPGEPDVIQ